MDCLQNKGISHTEVKDPLWKDVENAIKRLDQQAYTDVNIGMRGHGYLGVSGGCGRYFVYLFTEDERGFRLSNSSQDFSRSKIVAGGQLVNLCNRNIVTLEEALAAARSYFETGELDALLKWDNE